MRTRHFFVSNSSSCSYVVSVSNEEKFSIEEVNASKILDLCRSMGKKDSNSYICIVKDKGMEGDDFFHITGKVRKAILSFPGQWLENNSDCRMVLIRNGVLCPTYYETASYWENSDSSYFDIGYTHTDSNFEFFLTNYLIKEEDYYEDEDGNSTYVKSNYLLFFTESEFNPLIDRRDLLEEDLTDGETRISVVSSSAVVEWIGLQDGRYPAFMDVYTLTEEEKKYLYSHWDKFVSYCKRHETRIYLWLEVKEGICSCNLPYTSRYVKPFTGVIRHADEGTFKTVFFED